MKTVIYLVVTCFISTGSLVAALNMNNSLPMFAIASGIWILFIRGCKRRAQKASQRRFREQIFEHHMRSVRNNQRYK